MSDWNSALYLKFERERTRAARDLLVQLPAYDPPTVYDLGCGPGNSTELLAQTFPNAEIVGIDSSEDMLAAARARVRGATFIAQRIEDWRPARKAGLIFANAVLQFVPDHQALMPRLASYLLEGGWLAVQMPHNIHEVSHALMRMVAADGPWADRLVPIAKTRPVIGSTEDYYHLLAPSSACFEIWQTTYVHALDGPGGIVEWFAGSALRPFLDPLRPREREAFLARYKEELAAAYPMQSNGKVLLRYPRLFFIAQR
ncbi:MAG: trans-aconitate 2-methyltransferase [Methylocystis sp.]|jgi:trans-aconitate 2-methyltransferase